jgi:hypothetical protein
MQVGVWGDKCQAYDQGDDVAIWLCDFLGQVRVNVKRGVIYGFRSLSLISCSRITTTSGILVYLMHTYCDRTGCGWCGSTRRSGGRWTAITRYGARPRVRWRESQSTSTQIVVEEDGQAPVICHANR